MPDNQLPTVYLDEDRPSLPERILELAAMPEVDVGKIQILYDLHKQIKADQAKEAFEQAKFLVSKEVGAIKKEGKIPLKEGNRPVKYARYPDIMEALQPALDRNGLDLRFDRVDTSNNLITVYYTLSHIQGHAISGSFGPIPPDTGPGRSLVQAFMSAATYAKRYCVINLFNLVTEDDDADSWAAKTASITDEQAKEIADLLANSDVSDEAFLKVVSVKSISEIPAANFAMARNYLRNKQRKEPAPNKT